MKTFTIDIDNNISVFATPDEAAAATTTPFESFTDQKELAKLAATWPAERLVEIWNSLAGVEPVTTFKSAKTAAGKIWEQVQGLGEPEKLKVERKAKGGAQAAKGAPAKGNATKKASPAKKAAKAPKTAKIAKAEKGAGPREGSKTAQLLAMLQRKNGATLQEIMKEFGWLAHTTRALMSAGGSLRKAGYTVESFKSDKGERTYRTNA